MGEVEHIDSRGDRTSEVLDRRREGTGGESVTLVRKNFVTEDRKKVGVEGG